MEGTTAFLAGAGFGAGLMFILDPQMGRRRRAIAEERAAQLWHTAGGRASSLYQNAERAAESFGRDVSDRAQSLASGDFGGVIGRQTMSNVMHGNWSPTARAVMGVVGGGMVLYGLTLEAPLGCVLGTVGVALAAEALTNAGLEDVSRVPGQVADMANRTAHSVSDMANRTAQTVSDVAGRAAQGMGFNQGDSRQQQQSNQPAWTVA